mmetsp:Transcript_76063/g.163277  ORF Transcript_76063/g.163277 Transcript_76063/m.163277 type:complete len:178 (-) Transcript_76063:120-653(-)
MGSVGDSAATLAPFGVGATLQQLGSGGFLAGRPRAKEAIHGVGYVTGGWDGDGARCMTPARPNLAGSRSAPSLPSLSMNPMAPAGSTYSSSMTGQPWDWEDLRRPRSVVRGREVNRFSKILAPTSFHGVPDQVPLGLTQNQYYRRQGVAHGSPHWPVGAHGVTHSGSWGMSMGGHHR